MERGEVRRVEQPLAISPMANVDKKIKKPGRVN
jgi:hypothetical protein